jgi:hypothetical protein
MHASEVIETYIDDTVRFLPRRQRVDVATELGSLLNDELQARAKQSGHAADESLALSLVRDYGRPNEVAARYHPPRAIIDPADSARFIRAAIIGAGVLIVLSAFGRRDPSSPGHAEDLVKIGILAWLGFLVVAFGATSWIRRRWPTTALWQPRDRDRVNRLGMALLVPIAAFVVVLYGAPLDAAWATYTADFQRLRLPCLLGLLTGLVALLTFVAIQGRWSRLSRRLNIGLNAALACLILSFAVDGNIFQSSRVDPIARDVLALVALIYVPSVGVQLYGEIGRLHRTPATR